MHPIRNSLLTIIFSLILLSPKLMAEEQKILKIAGWNAYTDPSHPNKIIGYENFEKNTGVKIFFKPLAHLDDIISTAESTEQYDIFIISNEGIRMLHDMNLVIPLELSALPHYQDLHHNLKYSELSQFGRKIYAVPWAWGPTGLIYNKSIIDKPTSWNLLWDPKYKGKVALWDDISMIWITALALGYQNDYSLTRMQLENVEEKLFSFNKQSGIYYKGDGDEIKLATQRKIVAYNSWHDSSIQLKKAGKNFTMIIPKEGTVGMFDSFLISANSKQAAIAHKYINHQISPVIQKKMLDITGLSPANLETLRLLKIDEIKALHLDEPGYFNRMLLWDNMPRKNLYEQVLKSVRDDLKKKK